MKYSFCETMVAGPHTIWHLRKLTKLGQMLGGGADTKALCGAIVAWDLSVPTTKFHLQRNCCQKCLTLSPWNTVK